MKKNYFPLSYKTYLFLMKQMKNYLKEILNPQQYEAAISTEWASLILASAGAWKTRTLTYKIAYMVYNWIPSSNILAVTFTNKAANEMKERLKEIMENEMQDINKKKDNFSENNKEEEPFSDEIEFWEEESKKSSNTEVMQNQTNDSEPDFDDILWEDNDIDSLLSDYDNTEIDEKSYFTPENERFNWLWTFHSVFLKILKQDITALNPILNTEFKKSFNIADVADTASVIRQILKKVWVKDTFTPREIKWKISDLKSKWFTAKDFLYQAQDDTDEIIWKIYQEYEKELRKQNTLDFDDLLLLPYLLFKKDKEVLQKWKNKFQYILVDEAQDTNKIQFELIHMLSGSDGNITLIWDDFQSIYGWRWAVIEEFLNAKKYWPSLKIFKLEINYRSKKTIVDAGNALILNNKNQYKKDIKAHNEKESKIKLIKFSSDFVEAEQIISLIKKLHEKWKKWSDFAIIYRTNAQSEPFEKVLLTENIPYKIYGWFKFYERKEIKDLLSYIKYLINPEDGISLSRIINVPSRKIWKTSVDKLLEMANSEWISLHDLISNIENTNISSAAQKNIMNFVNLIKYIQEKIKNVEPNKTIEIIVKAIWYEEHLKKEFWEEDTKERIANIGQLMNTAVQFKEKWIEWLRKFIDEISLFTDLQENLEENPDQIQLMTGHGSKWLEFDTVFLVWLEENIFPLSRARLNPKELEEERRLAYVGITRAKNNLFLSYAESRRQFWQLQYNQPSRFIEEIPMELITSFNSSIASKPSMKFQTWDKVKHKIFWLWEVMEVFSEKVIVRFYWWWIKQMMWRMLEKID